jgi:DNA-binding CsgD family transcriptional regulator
MTRVALVAASPHLRGELDAGFGQAGGIEVVLRAPSCSHARALGFGQAQVVVADAAPAGDDHPPLVLLVPAGADVCDAWCEGASVLAADATIDQLAAAVHAAAAGLQCATPRLVDRLAPAARAAPAYEPLTRREHEVLEQMSFGLGNREIAAALNISPHTAKFHVAQVIAKLEAGSRAHAVAKALRAGLVADTA